MQLFWLCFCLFVWDPGGCWGDTERIFNRLRCPVASIEALSAAHWLMSSVMYRRIALAIEMASKLDAFVLIVFFACVYGTLVVSRAIQKEYWIGRGVQWLKLKRWAWRICQCAWYHTGTSPWPSKSPENEVHVVMIVIKFAYHNWR